MRGKVTSQAQMNIGWFGQQWDKYWSQYIECEHFQYSDKTEYQLQTNIGLQYSPNIGLQTHPILNYKHSQYWIRNTASIGF